MTTLLFVTGSIALISTLLYFREYFLRQKVSKDQQKIAMATKQKSIQLINAAEMAETQVVSDGNYAMQKFISEFQDKIQGLIKSSEGSITTSQDQLIKFMGSLQKRSAEFEEASRVATEQRINQLFERLEIKLSDFLIQTEIKTTSSIELELKAARELITTYKEAQLRLIDENIIAMMEQTLTIVLDKKLSLKDQLDLVYEALEKAKIEKFVV